MSNEDTQKAMGWLFSTAFYNKVPQTVSLLWLGIYNFKEILRRYLPEIIVLLSLSSSPTFVFFCLYPMHEKLFSFAKKLIPFSFTFWVLLAFQHCFHLLSNLNLSHLCYLIHSDRHHLRELIFLHVSKICYGRDNKWCLLFIWSSKPVKIQVIYMPLLFL